MTYNIFILIGHYIEAERLLRVALNTNKNTNINTNNSTTDTNNNMDLQESSDMDMDMDTDMDMDILYKSYRGLILQCELYKLMNCWILALAVSLDAVDIITTIFGYDHIKSIQTLCLARDLFIYLNLNDLGHEYIEYLCSIIRSYPVNKQRTSLVKKIESFSSDQSSSPF